MTKFDFTSEYFLDISNKCRYNETMSAWYERMADMEYDVLYPLLERDEDRQSERAILYSSEYRRMNTYCNRSRWIRGCMKYGWLSDYYRMNGVKIVKSVSRCRDRFCYNCQSMDALQRFHEYAPVIDKFSEKFDIYHVVFSQPNVPGFLLTRTLDMMNESFSRWVGFMSGKKKIRGLDLVGEYGFVGAVRALEVSQNDKDSYYHPHFHCMVVLRKNLKMIPKHRNMFSVDHTHKREDRIFTDFEVFLQRIWYLLMNGIKVTKKNLESLPQFAGGRSYPDGFSCYAENADGHYHEIFKYATKGSYSNGSILNDFECFRTLYVALFRRRIYQTYGCFYNLDMNVIHEGVNFADMADVCFTELVQMLNEREKPEVVIEELKDILKIKVPLEQGKGIKYISVQSIRYAFDECPVEQRGELKEKLIRYIWNRY